MADEASGVRGSIAEALEGRLTPDQITFLVDEVLATTKKPWAEFSCKKCGARQRQMAEIPDARAVTAALDTLMNQSWGRPTDAKHETEIVVNRHVYLVAEEDEQAGEVEAHTVASEVDDGADRVDVPGE
jgi:hypothetical protein